MEKEHERHAQIASGLNIIVGLWLMASPYIFLYSLNTSALWNSLISGAVIAIIGLVRLFQPREVAWLSWVNFIVGLWVIVSPFVFAQMPIAAIWDGVITGIVAAILSSTSARETSMVRSQSRVTS